MKKTRHEESESAFVTHVPCESCGSSDAGALYSDGHTFCHKCQATRAGDGAPTEAPAPRRAGLIGSLEFKAIPKRKLDEATCRRWGYGFGVDPKNGTTVQVATYYDAAGAAVAQKLRGPNKAFRCLGEGKDMPLYGQWLWPAGGKMLVITEGEIDAMTVSQLGNLKWPVVSVPNGAPAAAKAIRRHLNYVESFETVVFMFDMDEEGIKAASECAALLTPGKAKIAKLPLKDANDCLVAGQGEQVINAQWRAETYRPDGILDSEQLRTRLKERKSLMPIATFPMKRLQEMTMGFRPSEIVTFCAGSGIGKSEFVRQCALWAREQGLKIGYIGLEENVERTCLGLVGMKMNRQLRMLENPLEVPGFWDAFDAVIKDHVFVFDHFGSLDSENLIAKLRYLRVGCGVDIIVLDHISIVVSGSETDDERRDIDVLMTNLRSLAEETGVAVLAVSHLKQPNGKKTLEEGAPTSLALLRGSRSIGQISDTVIGLERNQQDEETKDITTFRILKCRWTGRTGIAGAACYNAETGRMTEVAVDPLVGVEPTIRGGDY